MQNVLKLNLLTGIAIFLLGVARQAVHFSGASVDADSRDQDRCLTVLDLRSGENNL
jgi:hypothetical protein